MAEIRGEPEPALKSISLEQSSITSNMFGNDGHFTFGDDGECAASITSLPVNGTAWEEVSYGPYSSGACRTDSSGNRLAVAGQSFEDTAALKSGDVIVITATGCGK